MPLERLRRLKRVARVAAVFFGPSAPVLSISRLPTREPDEARNVRRVVSLLPLWHGRKAGANSAHSKRRRAALAAIRVRDARALRELCGGFR